MKFSEHRIKFECDVFLCGIWEQKKNITTFKLRKINRY